MYLACTWLAPPNLLPSTWLVPGSYHACTWTASGLDTQVQQLGLTVSNPPTQAEMQAIDDKLDVVITGLASGKQCLFHVRAIGAAGLSVWRDPATKRAT